MRRDPLPNHPRAVKSAALLAFLAAVGTAACELTTEPSGALPAIPDEAADVVPDTLRVRYEEDAARLAVRYLRETGAPGADSVEIPARYTASFYNALAAIYAFDHSARDSVVEMYGVRTFPNPPLYSLLVGVDTTHDWTQAWREGRALTGNAAVDSLVEAYDLILTDYSDMHDFAVLRASAPLNIPALTDYFERIAGVEYADPNHAVGGGADIVVEPDGLALRLDYSVGYGDCPAGCINRHTWSFRVDMDGEVRYLGSSGDPAP